MANTMTICAKCKSVRLVEISGKTCDSFGIMFINPMDGISKEKTGKWINCYPPEDFGIGGGDMVELIYCLECGQIQSKEFPVKPDTIKEQMKYMDGDFDEVVFEWRNSNPLMTKNTKQINI